MGRDFVFRRTTASAEGDIFDACEKMNLSPLAAFSKFFSPDGAPRHKHLSYGGFKKNKGLGQLCRCRALDQLLCSYL